MWYIKVCRDISLETRDLSREWQFVWPYFLRFRSKEQMVIAVISDNA